MTPRRFKCSQVRKSNLDFNFECTKLLQNDVRKQRYITLNASSIPGQDRIYPKTHLCRTFLLSLFVHYTFSSILVAEWPPFGQSLPTRLAICSDSFVYLYFLFISHFGFKSGSWLLIAPVLLHCFSINFNRKNMKQFSCLKPKDLKPVCLVCSIHPANHARSLGSKLATTRGTLAPIDLQKKKHKKTFFSEQIFYVKQCSVIPL